MQSGRFEMEGFLAVILILLISPSLAGADAIILKNGNRIEAKRVWEEDGDVKCEQYGGVVGFPKREVLRTEQQQSDEGPGGTQQKALSTGRNKISLEKAIFPKVRQLYLELMKFKDDSVFHKVGFAPENKYGVWLDKVTKLTEDAHSNGLLIKGIPVEDLLNLGLEYLKSRGKETPFSRFANGEFRRAFDL